MKTRRTIARQRLADAVDVLRGRPPRFDYGLLLVMPFIAAAGGVLISFLIEDAVERHRAGADGAAASRAASRVPEATPQRRPITTAGERRFIQEA